MRYAIFSDIHGNLRAWEETLADIRAQQVDVLICLGDAVGYGPKPEEVLNGIRSVTGNFIMGNHDAAAAGLMDYSIFNDNAKHSIEWTMQTLSKESREYLSSVPLAIESEDVFFVHAEISEPGRFSYIDDSAKAQENFSDSNHFVTFVGHTHHPKIFQLKDGNVSELPGVNRGLDSSCRYIVNVGSVGEPRNEHDLRGVYAIYDSETRHVDFRRIAFDIEAYRTDLESTSLEIRPYFLQCYEFQSAESQSLPFPDVTQTLAMEAPAVAAAPISQGDGSVNLQILSAAQLSQNSVAEKTNKKRSVARTSMLIVLSCVVWIALIIGGIYYYNQSQEPDDSMAEADDTAKIIDESDKTPDPSASESKPLELTQEKPELKPKPVKPKPDLAAKSPSPKPVPKPAPAPKPKPIPKPAPKPDPTVAWWRMEANSEGEKLVDLKNKWSLSTLAQGKTISGIAPAALLSDAVTNTSAMSLGVWAEPNPSGEFALRADRSFTFEGWFLVAKTRKAVFLAGTRSGDANDKQGWHIDIRPNGQMCFFYDNGPDILQALSKKLPVADLNPHHFAAVWDHDASAGAGAMLLYLDGEQVAAAKVPRAKIPKTQANPFSIGAPKNPSKVGLDEVRFSRGALKVSEFLLPAPPSIAKNGLVMNLVGDALSKTANSTGAAHRPKLVTNSGLPLLRFDGKDDYISIPDSDKLDLNAWTIVSVVRPLGGPGVVISKTNGKNSMTNYRLQIEKDGKVGALVRGATDKHQVNRGANVNVFKRYSVVAARFDPQAKGIEKIKISVDGVPASYSYKNAVGNVSAITHKAPLMIGRQPGKDARHFKGDVGAVLLYNRALSDKELTSTSKWLMQKISTAKSAVANKATKPSTAVGPKDAIVFLIAGEGNASGIAAFSPQTNAQAKMQEKHPTNPKTTAAEVGIPTSANHFPRSHIWKPLKGPFEKLTPGQNLQASWDPKRHGIELPMAMLLQRKYPQNDIYFIKHAPVGSSLHTQWRAGNGSEYKKFIRQVTPAMTHLKKKYSNVRVVGLYWDQGESDEKQSRQYEGNLRKLIDALRKDAGQPDLQVYLREQGVFQQDNRAFRDIASAQARLAKRDANTHLLKLDLGSNEKNYKAWAWSIGNGHLSSKAYLKLSRDIIKQVK